MQTSKPPIRHSPDIFKRLELRGVGLQEYGTVKRILWMDLPQSGLFFQKHFDRRPTRRVLEQVEQWRRFLESDFLLSKEEKRQIEGYIERAESLAWSALVEDSFTGLGSWKLSRDIRVVQRRDYSPQVIQEITAHRFELGQKEPQETRRTEISDQTLTGHKWCKAWEKAFEELGLLECVLQQAGKKRLVTPRRPQAWPIFTRAVIPKLYEFLLPLYKTRGNVWSGKEKAFKRNAMFSQNLLQDILEILRTEHPDVFTGTTLGQLKAVIQRYLDSKPRKY